ncbi:hypothetical protein [Caldisphaera sp.]|uniref:hypothetical protein n=1 Tax=Caldisphaera sp. TaxID=2060322 RepID=UPI0025C481EE|nr:hypothetical protein [Caldisphaera sp.]
MEKSLIFKEWFDFFENFKKDDIFKEEILNIPSFPAIANNNGIYDVKIGANIKLTWLCCNTYQLKINGGGLLSSIPDKPIKNLVFNYKSYSPNTVIQDSYIINPLGFIPHAPILNELNYGNCFSYNNKKIYVRDSDPFSKVKTQECLEVKKVEGKSNYNIGSLQFNVIDRYSLGRINIYETNIGTLFTNNDITLLFNHENEIIFKIPYHDISFFILYPFKFFRFHTRKSSFRTNVFVLNSEIGFVSNYGFELEFESGQLKINSSKPFYIVKGGILKSFNTLIDINTNFSYGYEIINHIRSGYSSVILSEINNKTIEFDIFNVSGYNSIIEILPKIRTEKMEICSHLGCYDILDSAGIYRIPSPSGCYCKAKIYLSHESSIKNKLLNSLKS